MPSVRWLEREEAIRRASAYTGTIIASFGSRQSYRFALERVQGDQWAPAKSAGFVPARSSRDIDLCLLFLLSPSLLFLPPFSREKVGVQDRGRDCPAHDAVVEHEPPFRVPQHVPVIGVQHRETEQVVGDVFSPSRQFEGLGAEPLYGENRTEKYRAGRDGPDRRKGRDGLENARGGFPGGGGATRGRKRRHQPPRRAVQGTVQELVYLSRRVIVRVRVSNPL